MYLTAELFPVGAQSDIAAGLGTSADRVGLLLSAYALVAAATTMPLLSIARRYDQRAVLAACLVVLAVSQVGFALSGGFVAAMVWRASAAAVHGILWSQATVVAAALAAPKHTARAGAAVFVGSALALVAGVPATAVLSHVVGWRTTSLIIACIACACAVTLRAVLPSIPSTVRNRRTHRARSGVRGDAIAIGGVGVMTLLLVTGHYVSYAFIEPLIVRGGVGRTLVAPLLAVYGGVGVVGVWLAGRYLDTRPRLVTSVLVGSLVIGLSAFALPTPGNVVAGIAVWGMAAAAIPVVANTAALRATEDRRDIASAIYVVAYQVGIACGSAIGAGLYGSVEAVWLPAVSIGLIVFCPLTIRLTRI